MTSNPTPPVVPDAPLPEAGGVAWIDIFSPKSGAKISLTSRKPTAIEALDDLVAAIKYAEEKYGFTPQAGVAVKSTKQAEQPAVQPAPDSVPMAASQAAPETAAGETTEVMQVTTFEVQANKRGEPSYKVMGGNWQKFGVICWPEVMSTKYDLDALEMGKTYQGEGYATVLMVDGKPKKVLAFTDTP